MKKCDVCGRPVPKKMEAEVDKGMANLDIEEFEEVVQAMACPKSGRPQ